MPGEGMVNGDSFAKARSTVRRADERSELLLQPFVGRYGERATAAIAGCCALRATSTFGAALRSEVSGSAELNWDRLSFGAGGGLLSEVELEVPFFEEAWKDQRQLEASRERSLLVGCRRRADRRIDVLVVGRRRHLLRAICVWICVSNITGIPVPRALPRRGCREARMVASITQDASR